MAEIRRFASGATRNTDDDKLDFEAFLSPRVLERYAQYMHKNRIQPDGTLRAGDNWQAGIPKDAYMKSAWRHFWAFWSAHRGLETAEDIQTSLCALMFNVMGYLYEELNERNPE